MGYLDEIKRNPKFYRVTLDFRKLPRAALNKLARADTLRKVGKQTLL